MCVSSASTGPCGGQRVNRCPYRDRQIGNPPAPLDATAANRQHRLRLAAILVVCLRNWRVAKPLRDTILPHGVTYSPQLHPLRVETLHD